MWSEYIFSCPICILQAQCDCDQCVSLNCLPRLPLAYPSPALYHPCCYGKAQEGTILVCYIAVWLDWMIWHKQQAVLYQLMAMAVWPSEEAPCWDLPCLHPRIVWVCNETNKGDRCNAFLEVFLVVLVFYRTHMETCKALASVACFLVLCWVEKPK